MNLHEDEVKETKPDHVSDAEPIALEPEAHNDINVQIYDQDHVEDVPVSSAPESVQALERSSTAELAPAEPFINSPDLHPGVESQPATPPNEAEGTPATSLSVEPPQPRLAHFYFCISDSCSLAFKFGLKVASLKSPFQATFQLIPTVKSERTRTTFLIFL